MQVLKRMRRHHTHKIKSTQPWINNETREVVVGSRQTEVRGFLVRRRFDFHQEDI